MAIRTSSVIPASEPAPSEPRVPAAAPAGGWRGWLIGRTGPAVGAGELIYFSSQLSLMLEVGTSLTQALSALAAQTKHPTFRQVISQMVRHIEDGHQLSEAMGRHPQVFDGVFVSMVRAGESGGFLKDILDRTVEMQRRRQALITQLRAALTYPAVLAVLSVIVVIFILTSILPKFTAFFAGKESILPVTTRGLIVLSASLRGYWWAYIVVLSGAAVGLRFWLASDRGRATRDLVMIRAPFLSRLANKIYTCQLLRTLGHLMQTQVPLLDALRMTRTTIRNRYYQEFCGHIADRVREGGKFSRAFSEYPFVIESVRQMMVTAEETGNLPAVMLRLAEYYDEEVDRDLKVLAATLEPIALVLLGSVVGMIVASVVLPLFKLVSALH